MVAFTVDGFHDGERRSTYSAANFVSVGPEAGRGTGLPPPFSRARKASAAARAWSGMDALSSLRIRAFPPTATTAIFPASVILSYRPAR